MSGTNTTWHICSSCFFLFQTCGKWNATVLSADSLVCKQWVLFNHDHLFSSAFCDIYSLFCVHCIVSFCKVFLLFCSFLEFWNMTNYIVNGSYLLFIHLFIKFLPYINAHAYHLILSYLCIMSSVKAHHLYLYPLSRRRYSMICMPLLTFKILYIHFHE